MNIGLTYTGSEWKHQNYVNWLCNNDPSINIFTLSVEDNNAQDLLQCDALVLSGGIDMHPELTDGDFGYKNRPDNGWRKDRDLFEQSLVKQAIDRNLPVLGICRGLQLMNVLYGGTLITDLADRNPLHRGEEADKAHEVMIERGSLLHSITGIEKGEVSSAHHQAIHTVGAELMINCTAADGTIEGIEWKNKENKPFLLCVQWHPERMFSQMGSPLTKKIRDHFISVIQSSTRQQHENH